MSNGTTFRFDFAISFAGADREIANIISNQLEDAGFRVFYDKKFIPELLGEEGSLYLRKLYSIDAQLYIILASKAYDKSTWTILEREAIEAREASVIRRNAACHPRAFPNHTAVLHSLKLAFGISVHRVRIDSREV